MKRRSAAELGCFARRAGLVLKVLSVPDRLSYGAVASHLEARGDVGPPYKSF